MNSIRELLIHFQNISTEWIKLFSKISNSASDRRDSFYNMNDINLKKLENDYYNYKLLEIVTKPYERKKILVYNNTLVQNTDPIYLDPIQERIS